MLTCKEGNKLAEFVLKMAIIGHLLTLALLSLKVALIFQKKETPFLRQHFGMEMGKIVLLKASLFFIVSCTINRRLDMQEDVTRRI